MGRLGDLGPAGEHGSTKPRCRAIFWPRCSAMPSSTLDRSMERKSGTESSIMRLPGKRRTRFSGFFRQTEGIRISAGGDRAEGPEGAPRPRPQQRPHRRGPMLGLPGHAARGGAAGASSRTSSVSGSTSGPRRNGAYEHFTLQSLRDFEFVQASSTCSLLPPGFDRTSRFLGGLPSASWPC